MSYFRFFKSFLEQYVLDAIQGKKRGISFLRLMSFFYQRVIAVRHLGYDRGYLSITSVSIPVISIGNITAGGNGKTPLVHYLAQELMKDYKVGILIRGYRSLKKNKTSFCLNQNSLIKDCGDEALWLYQKLSQVQVWVGPDRVKSALNAEEQKCQIVILDDGFQHRGLKRDFEIIMINGLNPLGNNLFLPGGLLRDSPKRLKYADLILVTDPYCIEEIQKKLSVYTQAPMIFIRMQTHISLKGKKIGVFCALGSPQRFIKLIEGCGGIIMNTFFKPDHASFDIQELSRFAQQSSVDMLVCTEKDAVKLPDYLECSIPIIIIPAHIQIIQGEEIWKQFLHQVKKRLETCPKTTI